MTTIFPLSIVTPPDPAGATERSEAIELAAVRGGVITIGNFDGVHRGHAELLRHVRRLADEIGGPAVAVVMDPHPATILRPHLAPKRLTWIERRAELMDVHGIDGLVVCETNRRFLGMTATEFFDSLVQDHLKARAMVEGPNFFFGRDRGGDIRRLGSMCGDSGIDLKIVEPTNEDGRMISSTRIRGLLSDGDVLAANQLLGHPHRIRGSVVAGAKRGRQIGFPTANLTQIDVVIPALGVYGGRVTIDGKEYGAAIHVGPVPTFEDSGETKVEVHVLNYDGDLYGRQLEIDFLHHVREIVRFDSTEALISQLHQDISTIRSALNLPLGEQDESGASQD
ncbi:MAG: riboflavin biosynthesis protein RibF [Rubripirellula sp.]